MSKPVPASGVRRTLWIAAAVMAAFTLFGFFVAPSIIKAQLEKRASALLGRAVTVQKVRVNPYAVSVTLEGLEVRRQDGTGSFLGWDRLYVNLDPLVSITGTLTVGAIELDGFHASVEQKADGTFNFADILARLQALASATPAKPGESSHPVRLASLKVSGARVDFRDEQPRRPFATTFGPVSFTLTEFVTAGAPGAPYRFEAVSEAGEKFTWTGTLSADPLASKGEFAIANLLLKKYTPYSEDRIQADITDGRLGVSGRYEAGFAGAKKTLTLAGGEVHLRDLKVVERATQQPALELPALDVTGIAADAIALKATVERVEVDVRRAAVRREKDGAINLLAMLQPAAPPAPAAPATPAPRPEFMVGEVAVKHFAVEVEDLAAPRAARLGLKDIQLSLKKVTLADGAEMPLQLALEWAPRGTVKVDGVVAIKPALKADLKTDVAGLEILPLSPYLEQFVNARVTEGAVSSAGALQVALAGDAPAITFAGDVTVGKFGLVDAAHNEALAGFAALDLKGLKAATAPQLAVSLAEVNVAAPYARVIVNEDKTLNLATLAKASPAGNAGGTLRPDTPADAGLPGPQASPASPTPAAPPKIGIGRVVIADGDFSLADRSLAPAVHLAISQFGGTVAGLSSENLTRADVDLKATVDGAGPIAITGKLDPFGATRFVDLKVDFKNVDLLPLSPYSGKYAGYELARGKLGLDIAAKLSGDQLDATNVITLNQFTFGAPVESPDATKLPVRLGVALLKDINGQIVVDVPMSGNVNDPDLRIGKVVLRVVVNLLTKAAVSPFALLGSMFGGGGDELAYQEFAPGGSELQPAERKKLETMARALTNRPGLSLALEGGYDGPADTFALKHTKLEALVRGRIWEERHALDPNIPAPDRLEIAPEARAAMVLKLFTEKFPPGTEFGAPLAKAPAAAAPPPKPKRSFFGKVVDVVTLKEFRNGEGAPAQPASAGAPEAAAPAGGPSLEEMTGRLAETMTVTDEDLRALAAARAQRVRDYFATEGRVAADRLFLAQGGAAKENKGPRVFLSLQ